MLKPGIAESMVMGCEPAGWLKLIGADQLILGRISGVGITLFAAV